MTAPSLTLSPDQRDALAALHVFAGMRIATPGVLVGPAGTGKTTLLGVFARECRRSLRFAAPTGRAAKVLSSKLVRAGLPHTASTIHRALYGAPIEDAAGELDFGEPREPIGPGGLLIIDEASMVDDRIHADIMSKLPPGAGLLYVGDREQLPPVSGTWGPAFDDPTVALTEVHRQALESPIVRIATDIRTGGQLPHGDDGDYRWKRAKLQAAADWMAERSAGDAVLLASTNHTRKALNGLVRKGLGFRDPVSVGDRLVVLSNDYHLNLMNGELIDVVAVEHPADDLVLVHTACGRDVFVAPSLLGATHREHRAGADERFETLLHCDYGWALTVHKSQGSEWCDVALVVDDGLASWWQRDAETVRRLLYTGVTRARMRLHVLDVRRGA